MGMTMVVKFSLFSWNGVLASLKPMMNSLVSMLARKSIR